MNEKQLYVLAEYDQTTQDALRSYQDALRAKGITGSQTEGPFHITMAVFESIQEQRAVHYMQELSQTMASFDVNLAHLGMFGQRVLFATPIPNYKLLLLREAFEEMCVWESFDWVPHSTILIHDQPAVFQQAAALIAPDFAPITAKIETLSLYEFFPERFVAKFPLKR